MENPHFQSAETIRTEAEAIERFSSVSQFILESQKQYFESLKFSLNMWTLINSGAAIALLGKEQAVYVIPAVCFMVGAVLAGIGNLLLFAKSHSLLCSSYLFVCNHNQTYIELINKQMLTYKKLYILSSIFLSVSYGIFIFTAAFLVYK